MRRIIYIAVALVAMMVSCKEDYLATAPSTAVGETELVQSPDVFNSYIDGLHAYVYYVYGRGWGGINHLNINRDFMGDDWVNTIPANRLEYYRWQSHRSPNGEMPYYYWDFYYTLAERANRIIELANQVNGASEVQINTWLGEAYTIRAWAYHNLVQLYGKRFVKGESNNNPGVLLRLKLGFEHLPRATVAEVYAQINEDIAKGLDYYAKGLDLGRKNRIRPSTAYGIAARIALTQEEWAKAAEYADLAITKSGATLQSGDKLVDGFNSLEASEWMWGYTHNPAQTYGYGGMFCYFAYNFYGYETRYAANRTLLNRMGDKDVRWKWFVCLDRGDKLPSNAEGEAKNYHFGITTTYDNLPGYEFTAKPIKWYVKDPTLSVSADQLVMRLAEMYYIKAEGLAKSGDEAGAKETLVDIMVTRDPDYSNSTVASFAGDALVDEILTQRAIDLWGEGHRFYDMKRNRIIPVRDTAANCQAYRNSTVAMEQYFEEQLVQIRETIADLKVELAGASTDAASAIQKKIGDMAKDSTKIRGYISKVPELLETRVNRFKNRELGTLPASLDDKLWEFVIPIDEIQGNPKCEQNPM